MKWLAGVLLAMAACVPIAAGPVPYVESTAPETPPLACDPTTQYSDPRVVALERRHCELARQHGVRLATDPAPVEPDWSPADPARAEQWRRQLEAARQEADRRRREEQMDAARRDFQQRMRHDSEEASRRMHEDTMRRMHESTPAPPTPGRR